MILYISIIDFEWAHTVLFHCEKFQYVFAVFSTSQPYLYFLLYPPKQVASFLIYVTCLLSLFI